MPNSTRKNVSRKSELERFAEKFVINDDGCWHWTASKFVDGYGKFKFWDESKGKSGQRAYRYSYQFFRGSLPIGLELDHLCRNRACVNPDHLEPVTTAENARRGRNVLVHPEFRKNPRPARNICVNGHLIEGHNALPCSPCKTYFRCRICYNESRRNRKRQLAATG